MIDYIVLIPTHNRSEKLSSLINTLSQGMQSERMLVCILNSGSVEAVDNILLRSKGKNILHLKLPNNYYWSMAILLE